MKQIKKKRKYWIVPIAVLLLAIILTACKQEAQPKVEDAIETTTRIIVDQAGRQHEIPLKIDKVYTTGPMGSIFLYTMAPEKMIGWNNDLNEDSLPYIQKKYTKLPVLGRWVGTDITGSIEEILKLSPDILINVGTISEEWISISDGIQEQMGVPVLMVNGDFFEIDEAYTFMGDVLGMQNRASQLADYAKEVENEIVNLKNVLNNSQKKSVYLASGAEGLETSSQGTINVELLEIMGGISVAETGGGRMDASIEQIFLWNPKIILISDPSGIKKQTQQMITDNNSVWNNIDAVKNRQIYTIPNLPFDWMNRPPSIMRLIGAQWIGSILYPDLYSVDIEAQIRKFMALFFNYEWQDDDFEKLIP